jgi:hypothetical protein
MFNKNTTPNVTSGNVGRKLDQVANWDIGHVEEEYTKGLPQPFDFKIVVNWHKLMVARLKFLQESNIDGIRSTSSLQDMDSSNEEDPEEVCFDYSPSSLEDLDSLSGSHLVSYLGYIVINCLKFITGDEGGKTRAEFPAHVSENFNKFWGQNVTLPTPPPHPRLAALLARSFSTKSPMCLSLLSPLVWTMKNPPRSPSVNLDELLREGILEPLSNYSLGAFYWYVKANDYINNLLLKEPNMASIKMSINRMIQFNNKLLRDTEGKQVEVTWKWARIFNSKAFPDLSIENNVLFTLTCIALTEGRKPDHQVWQMQSIRPYLEMKDIAIKLADNIRQMILKSFAKNFSSQLDELIQGDGKESSVAEPGF